MGTLGFLLEMCATHGSCQGQGTFRPEALERLRGGVNLEERAVVLDLASPISIKLGKDRTIRCIQYCFLLFSS